MSRPPIEAKVVGLSQYEWAKFDGNVTHVCSLAEVELLKALWDAYNVEQGLALILTGEAASACGALLTRVSLTRQSRQAKLETVALLQLGTGSPGMRPVQKAKATAVTKVARCSVRIVVPSHYRQLFVDNAAKDKAQAILADLASATGVPAHQLTGGRWELQKFGTKGSQLLGWVRVPAQVADKLTRSKSQLASQEQSCLCGFPKSRTNRLSPTGSVLSSCPASGSKLCCFVRALGLT